MDCSSLSKVTCRWTDLTGVKISYYVFDDIDSEATLYVPKGTKSIYEATTPCSEFKYIIEMDEEAGIEAVSLSDVVVSYDGGNVSISGLADGEHVQLYDLSGRQLSAGTSSAGNVSLSTAGASGTIVVKIGGESIKVML